MFYLNLNYVDKVLSPKVKKYQICFYLKSLETLVTFYAPALTMITMKKVTILIILTASTSFLSDSNSGLSTPFTIGLVRLDICLIYYVVNHVTLPSKSNSSHLTKADVAAIFFFGK